VSGPAEDPGATPTPGSLRWHEANHAGAWGYCGICDHQRGDGSRRDFEPGGMGDPWLTRDQQIRIAALEVARHVHPRLAADWLTPDETTMLFAQLLATGDLVAEWITTGRLAEVTEDETGAETGPGFGDRA
jgi:hypothetical protein